MKRNFSLLFFMLFTSVLFSQNWLKNLPQDKPKADLTLPDYKNAFEKYWAPYTVIDGSYVEKGVKKKAAGWKQFKRWEYNMESQTNPVTGEFPKKTAQDIYKEYLSAHPQLKSANSANWISLGPNNSNGGYAGVGRINCIAFHPSDNNTYWVGAAAGGLWVTTNNGSSWTCLTDNNGVLAVSDIVIPTDYATTKTIYIATGDKDSWDNCSIGLLKSTNGGSTWNTTGLSFPLSSYNMVYRLLLNPVDNQTIIAATDNGVYKTTNGGATWSNGLTSTAFIDMEFKPGDFNTLYGSTQYDGKIYVSSDGGVTWTQAFSDISAKRIELAVSANQPTWVYAIATSSNNGLYGIYKSTNSGSDYTRVFAGTNKNLLGYDPYGSDSGGQGWYDLSLAASQSDANTLLIGGVNTWRSTNGGSSWSLANHWVGGGGAQEVHADKHMLKYRNNGDLFECNDGGVYISTDNGTFWTDKSNGLVISQMYKLSVSQTVSDEVITGLQDNGTKLLSGGSWRDVKSGDGMECLIDYTDVKVQYGTYTYGQITRTTDHWVNTYTDIEPSGAGDGAWVTPYIIDPINNQTLYAGYADVWKTTNRGDTWTKISSINAQYKIRSMAIAPSNAQVLYVAELYKIWKTSNAGASWTDITGTLPVGYGDITSIAVKNDDANTLWVTFGNYNSSRVYQSTDGGTSWTNISAGLPDIPVFTIVQNKQSTSEVQLYVGTELGIYFKKGNDDWVAYSNGLPNVKIGEIEIYYAANPQDSKLRVATYGRGLWESPVYYSSVTMTYVSSTTTQNNTAIVAPNQTNQEIIGIQIVTNGDLSPLSATSFTFNTTGTTSPATDITNAKLYFTGTNNSFSTSTQFGSTSDSPNGTFSILGTQTLSGGTNYFWLTYDVPSTATISNILDAQCTSLTVGTAKTPTVTNPAGNRIIKIEYCAAGSTVAQDEYISNVTIGSINQASGSGTSGYEDYTSQITTMVIGDNSTATINVTNPYSSDQILIWVDWNQDGDFTDTGENVYASSGSFYSPHTTNFAPPAGAKIGTTRMRIRLHYLDLGPNVTPCDDASYGEVEDYSINVTSTCLTPTSQASAISFFGVSTNSMNINWTSGNGSRRVVKINTSNSFTAPSNGANPTPNSSYSGSGEQVVYNDNGNSVTVTGLSAGITYWFRVYEANCTGSSSLYYTATATNNPNSQSTTPGICQPNWTNVTYTNSTTAYCNVKIKGVAASSNDKLGVFVGNECRGIGNIIINNNEAYATINIQGISPETAIFKIWDTSECTEYESCSSVTTNPGGSIGNPPNYLMVDVCSAITQTLNFASGWNLASLYVNTETKNTKELFGNVSSITQVKNMTKSWDPSVPDFLNTLQTLSKGDGYFIKTQSACTIDISGPYIGNDHSINLTNGWNLIGYPYDICQEGKTGLKVLLDNSKVIQLKNMTQSYDPLVPDFLNTLKYLSPGEGYFLKVNGSYNNFTLPEPTVCLKSAEIELSSVCGWQFTGYEKSTIAYGEITLNNLPVTGDAYIGAFIGNECRSVMPLVENNGRSYASMVINGDEKEQITFRLCHDGNVYESTTTILSNPGESIHSIIPIPFNSIVQINQGPELIASPNPFSRNLEIKVRIFNEDDITINIYNTESKLIKSFKIDNASPGYYKFDWEAKDFSGNTCATGMYFIQLYTKAGSALQKVILDR